MVTASIDLTADGPCEPEPEWRDRMPWCAAACPFFRFGPNEESCAHTAVPSRSRVLGRVCGPAVRALTMAAIGHPLPTWAKPLGDA